MTLKSLLEHPLTRGIDIDDPATTEKRKQIISEKPFLRKIYEDWYSEFASESPKVAGHALELGSGAGFLAQLIPDLFTSEVFPCSDIQLVLDGCAIPFKDSCLRAIYLLDVLHHLPDVEGFFHSAERCLVDGGRIICIEPWVSNWSKIIYRNLHHEPFVPDAVDWRLPPAGPLSGANGALPWIVFERDRQKFQMKFPRLQIQTVKPFMPFRYLVSGGVSMRSLSPEWSYAPWTKLESLLKPWNKNLSMFACIVVERTSRQSP